MGSWTDFASDELALTHCPTTTQNLPHDKNASPAWLVHCDRKMCCFGFGKASEMLLAHGCRKAACWKQQQPAMWAPMWIHVVGAKRSVHSTAAACSEGQISEAQEDLTGLKWGQLAHSCAKGSKGARFCTSCSMELEGKSTSTRSLRLAPNLASLTSLCISAIALWTAALKPITQSSDSWKHKVTEVWHAIRLSSFWSGLIERSSAGTRASTHISSRFPMRALAQAAAWADPNNLTWLAFRSKWSRQPVSFWIKLRAPKPFLVLSSSYHTAEESSLIGPVHSSTRFWAIWTFSAGPEISSTP